MLLQNFRCYSALSIGSLSWLLLLAALIVVFVPGTVNAVLDSGNGTIVNGTINKTHHQAILANEIAQMRSIIPSVNQSRVRQVLTDVVNIMEQEAAGIGSNLTTGMNKTAHRIGAGLGFRFKEIQQKLFNNSMLRQEEVPLVVNLLHTASRNADAKLPAPLSEPVNATEVLAEAYADGGETAEDIELL